MKVRINIFVYKNMRYHRFADNSLHISLPSFIETRWSALESLVLTAPASGAYGFDIESRNLRRRDSLPSMKVSVIKKQRAFKLFGIFFGQYKISL